MDKVSIFKPQVGKVIFKQTTGRQSVISPHPPFLVENLLLDLFVLIS